MRRTLAVLTLLAAVVVALPMTASVKTHDIAVGVPTNAFTPSSLNIEVGDTVRWTNEAGNHNVVAVDGTFNSGAPSSDAWTYSFTFTKIGTYDYVGALHSQMTGVIVVVPGDDPSPTTISPPTSPTTSSRSSPTSSPRPTTSGASPTAAETSATTPPASGSTTGRDPQSRPQPIPTPLLPHPTQQAAVGSSSCSSPRC